MALTIVLIAVATAAAVVAAGQLGLLAGREPADLGVREGRLKAPSMTPNSVSSQASLYLDHPQRRYADIAPLPFKGDARASMARLRAVLQGMPGISLVKDEPEYLYAQCRTPLLRYVDDLELWADPLAGVIQVRSASRLGRKDFGVNRKRVDELRERYLAAP